jgi:epoxyqueuosine reductase
MSFQAKENHTLIIKRIAKDLGFEQCGISKAQFLEEEAPHLEKWLKSGMHGQMSYMERNFDMRLDPRILFEGAKSVVSLLYNYYPENEITNEDNLKISKYAYGSDYHKMIKKKLKEFLKIINEQIGEVGGRAFVDSAPILDKAWAKKAGLGWIGKNSNLINKSKGSFFFIAELILDIDLEYDTYLSKDFCGSCNKCIESCPTEAIVSPQVVDGSKCISYFTIELKNQINISDITDKKYDDWIFGCDVCQDVCPWNRFSKPTKEIEFSPNLNILKKNKKEWEEMTDEVFEEIIKKSPLKRTGLEGMKRNLKFIKKH